MPQGEKTVMDAEILNYVRTRDDPAFITKELADDLGMSTEGMRNRLEALHEAGEIHKKKPTSRTVVWWADCDHGQSDISA